VGTKPCAREKTGIYQKKKMSSEIYISRVEESSNSTVTTLEKKGCNSCPPAKNASQRGGGDMPLMLGGGPRPPENANRLNEPLELIRHTNCRR